MAGCRSHALGPGPGAYQLPTTVGFPKHDPTKTRNPQYTMGLRGDTTLCIMPGPGPTYDVGCTTRFGKATPNAYSMVSRKPPLAPFNTPGPGTYTLETSRRNPAYTMAPRTVPIVKNITPGPNQYSQPTTIGPKVPHKLASAAYSMIANHVAVEKVRSPGPATYGGTFTDLYKKRYPKYTMHLKPNVLTPDPNPGPAGYFPRMLKPCSTGYSFGNKHCGLPYITAEDVIPCKSGGYYD